MAKYLHYRFQNKNNRLKILEFSTLSKCLGKENPTIFPPCVFCFPLGGKPQKWWRKYADIVLTVDDSLFVIPILADPIAQ